MAKLIKPIPDLEQSYRDYIRELGDEERYPFPLDFDHTDFDGLLNQLADLEAGHNLPEGRVPSSTFWLVEGGELLGVSNLRHHLNEALEECGGHIGLGIRPSQRGKGLGNTLMRLTLQEAAKMGIDEVHVHCHKDNAASARMIVRCGGVLHSEVLEPSTDHTVQRYVIHP